MNNYDKNIDILQEETEIISEILNLPNQECFNLIPIKFVFKFF